ncbi:MAG: MFS transporter [Sporomusaceae bacterium]|nr:MFS transporter [Sporomusaceae bacterium]
MLQLLANIKGKYNQALMTGSLAHFIHDGFSDMLYIFFPIWQAQFSLTFAEVGFLKTLFSGFLAGFQIPSTFLASRLGEARTLLIGTIVTSISVFFYGLAPAFVFLCLLLVAGGLGSSVQHPLSSSIISSEYNDSNKRRVALSTFNVAGDMGKLVLPSGVSFIVSQYSWQAASQIMGIVGLAIAALLFINSRNLIAHNGHLQSDKQASGFSGWKASNAFWALLLIGIIDSSTRMGFLTFFPFLMQQKGAEVATIGIAFSLVFAGGAMGKFFVGTLATKVGVLRSVIITEILTTFFIISILNCSLHIVMIISLLLGIALNGTSSVLYGSVPDLVKAENQKQAFALFYTATIASGAVSPWLYGIFSDVAGINISVFVVALVALVTIPLTIPINKHNQTAQS